ncbi:MAG: hypothetical protein ACRDQ2_12415 [Gaiellales bacterium]
MIEAVIFDLDGVLVETEELWNAVRERLATERGADGMRTRPPT